MKELQFFTKDEMFTYINCDSVDYEEEKKQLLVQGFVVGGDRIIASNIEDAIVQHKNRFNVSLKEQALSSLVCALAASVR